MAFIQKISFLVKKKINFLSLLNANFFQIHKLNPFFLISFIVIFSILFFTSTSIIKKKNENNKENFKQITRYNEFSNLTNFLISKITSPYE